MLCRNQNLLGTMPSRPVEAVGPPKRDICPSSSCSARAARVTPAHARPWLLAHVLPLANATAVSMGPAGAPTSLGPA